MSPQPKPLNSPLRTHRNGASFVSTSKHRSLCLDRCIYILKNISKYWKSNPSDYPCCPIFQENEREHNLKWIKTHSPFGSLKLTVFTRNCMSRELGLLFDCGLESASGLWESSFVSDCYCWGNWQCVQAEGRDKMIRSKTSLRSFFLWDLETVFLSAS